MALRNLALGMPILLCLAVAPEAQESGVARIDPETSRIEDFGANLLVELSLSRPVLWRVFTLDAPRRLVVDFDAVDFRGTDLATIVSSDSVAAVVQRRAEGQWSRIVIRLSAPMRIETAGLAEQNPSGAALKLQLAPTTPTEFSDAAGPPEESVGAPPDEPGAPGRLLRAMVRTVFGTAEAG